MKKYITKFLMLAMILTSSVAHAWTPDKSVPVEIVSGFPPGGTNYTVAQMFSDYLKTNMGQETIITIKPGAGGVVATNYFVNRPADGTSVLLVVGLGMLVHPEIPTDQVTRHTLDNFEPVTIFGKTPSLLVTRSDSTTKTMEQFLSAGNAKISIGFTTVTQELIARSLSKNLTNVAFIPYKSSADVTRDVMSGSINYAITTVSSSGQLIEAGKLIALGTTQANSTIPEFDSKSSPLGKNFGAIVGIVLPKNTPKPIVDFYVQTTKKFIEVNKDKLHQVHMYLSDAEFGPKAFVADMNKLTTLVKNK